MNTTIFSEEPSMGSSDGLGAIHDAQEAQQLTPELEAENGPPRMLRGAQLRGAQRRGRIGLTKVTPPSSERNLKPKNRMWHRPIFGPMRSLCRKQVLVQ
jgi:hypothetical protein